MIKSSAKVQRGRGVLKGNTSLQKDAMRVLGQTSRTFIIPIQQLGPGLQEAVTAAYLSMRAIDEIEDHETLPKQHKIDLLYSIASLLKTDVSDEKLNELFAPFQNDLPEVSLRLGDWLRHAPEQTLATICKSTSIMAQGMADWVVKEWDIKNKEDLDDYTFYVAGLVGVLLTELWELYGETEVDNEQSVAFGRGLQLVNIISNRSEDLARGVDFFPKGWGFDDMLAYAYQNLKVAEDYTMRIIQNPIYNFCKIPLALAKGTLDAVANGKAKLSRVSVLKIVSGVLR